MKEEMETAYLATGSMLDSEAYQTESVVAVACMLKRNTLIAKIELVCFPARQQFNFQRSVSACGWMTDCFKDTHRHTQTHTHTHRHTHRHAHTRLASDDDVY